MPGSCCVADTSLCLRGLCTDLQGPAIKWQSHLSRRRAHPQSGQVASSESSDSSESLSKCGPEVSVSVDSILSDEGEEEREDEGDREGQALLCAEAGCVSTTSTL